MDRRMMYAKLHRATVTDCNIDYEGSLTLDPLLFECAGILPFEQVHVLDVTNGARFETYVIEGRRGEGDVIVNGAAARLVDPGDKIIILAYSNLKEEEARSLTPKVVLVDEANHPVGFGTKSGVSVAPNEPR